MSPACLEWRPGAVVCCPWGARICSSFCCLNLCVFSPVVACAALQVRRRSQNPCWKESTSPPTTANSKTLTLPIQRLSFSTVVNSTVSRSADYKESLTLLRCKSSRNHKKWPDGIKYMRQKWQWPIETTELQYLHCIQTKYQVYLTLY